jgi:hypothetical protein
MTNKTFEQIHEQEQPELHVVAQTKAGNNSYDRTYILCPHKGCMDIDCADNIVVRFCKGQWLLCSVSSIEITADIVKENDLSELI